MSTRDRGTADTVVMGYQFYAMKATHAVWDRLGAEDRRRMIEAIDDSRRHWQDDTDRSKLAEAIQQVPSTGDRRPG